MVVDPPFSFRSLGFLVASRHEFIRDLLHFALESFQAEDVRDAANGWEALRMWNALAPDIILTEMDIPPMGGAEVTRRLRDDPLRAGSPPVVLVFAHRPLEHDVLRSMKAGADDVLRLPFSARFLAQRIVRALARRHPGVRAVGEAGHPSPPPPAYRSPEWPTAANAAGALHRESILTPEEIRALTSVGADTTSTIDSDRWRGGRYAASQ